jgi:hypothetical protein
MKLQQQIAKYCANSSKVTLRDGKVVDYIRLYRAPLSSERGVFSYEEDPSWQTDVPSY